MRLLIHSFFAVALLTLTGCTESSTPGAPVATTEDEFAAYDAMIAADQEQTALDAAESEE